MIPATSILVYVGLDAVGDGLMKLPFLRALRTAYPTARITWMAGKGHTVYAGILAPVVAGLVDEVLDEAAIGSRFGELFGPRPLTGRSFDLIIDTQRRMLTTLILRRIRHRYFISAAAGFRLSAARPNPDWRRPSAMVGQLMTLVELATGSPAKASAPLPQDEDVERLAAQLLPSGAVYVGLAPGAGGKYKCWPLDRFLELARRLKEQGKVPVFLLGPAEGEWVDPIRAAMPDAVLPLQQVAKPLPMLTIALARRMVATISNDSGTGHMFAAADVPLISLFGPTPPEKFAPAAQRLIIVKAQDFGGDTMDLIPLDAVEKALVQALL